MSQANPVHLETPVVDPHRVTTSMRVALITLAAALFQVGTYLYFAWRLNAWQLVVLTGILTVFSLVNLTALVLIRRGRLETAGWLIIVGILLGTLAVAGLISGLTIVLAIILVILMVALSSQLLPPAQARIMYIASLPLGGVTIALDFLGLDYRLYAPSIQSIVTGVAVVVILALLALLIPRLALQIKSLQLKIALWAGAILVGIAVILLSYSAYSSRQAAIVAAEKETLAFAASQAGILRAEAEVPLDTARALAQALTAIKSPNGSITLSRPQVNAMLRQVLVENPDFLGIYTLWEPNAFDGLDSYYAGKEIHDQTGRLIPYWVRDDDGSIGVSALVDYETPGAGDWYLIPRQTKQEAAIAPVFYPINGVNTVMASFVVPIVSEGNFYGIAGVDAPMSFVQKQLDAVNLYNGHATAVLMTTSGTLIGVSQQPEMVSRQATEIFPDFAQIQKHFAAGGAFTSLSADGRTLRIFSPVYVGRTGASWYYGLLIPYAEVIYGATLSAFQQAGLGLGLILLGLVFLWILSGQIVRPVRNLTQVAYAVSQGNMDVRAEVGVADETGLLANAFNLMISQLRTLFETLEQRVAERTAKMERRNLDLALATEIGQTVSQVGDINTILTEAAEIIRTFFGLYYVQIYLTNPNETELVLHVGTGTVGAELLSRHHRLPLNTDSLNGQAAVNKRSIVIADTSASPAFRFNPLLPNTRSEIAVPLLVGDKLIGVLDAQSDQTGFLNEEALLAFEPMAGQLAIAIQNSRLVEETERARIELEKQTRRLVRANWQDYLDAIHKPEQTGFIFENNTVTPLEASRPVGQVTPPGESDESQPEKTNPGLIAPIEVNGEPLGALNLELDQAKQTPYTVELLNSVARQVTQQIENLRLLDSAERYRTEAEEVSRRQTREGWREYVDRSGENLGYLYNSNEVKPLGQETVSPETAVKLPVMIRDVTIGDLALFDISPDDRESLWLANEVANRLGTHLESLRQAEQILDRAQREQILRQVTSAVRASNDPEVILRTAVRELGNVFGRGVAIRMETARRTGPTSPADTPAGEPPLPPAAPISADDGGIA